MGLRNWLRVRRGHLKTIHWFWRATWDFWDWAWLPNVRLLRVKGAKGFHFHFVIIYELHLFGFRTYLKGIDTTSGVLDFDPDAV